MTATNAKEQHRRQHDSLLAAPEKRLLIWIAERLPQTINSDHLSLLGLLAMLAAGVAFWASSFARGWLPVVVAALAVNWFGDSLDGTVARVRGQQRPRYGYYVDHVLDVAGAMFLFGGMALSSHMSTVVGLVLLVAYLMVSAESYLATHARSVFKLSFLRVGPTELRLLLAAGALRVMVEPTVELFGRRFLLLDVGGIAGAAALATVFVASAVRNAAALYREEPLPRLRIVRGPHSGDPPCGGGGRGDGRRAARARRNVLRRVVVFGSVGLLGFFVQLAALVTLAGVLGIHYLPSTALAVELAILHNFFWHQRWTWSDRATVSARQVLARLLRFNGGSVATSMAGNLALMWVFVDRLGVHYALANVLAVLTLSLLNFVFCDLLVFRARSIATESGARGGRLDHLGEHQDADGSGHQQSGEQRPVAVEHGGAADEHEGVEELGEADPRLGAPLLRAQLLRVVTGGEGEV